MTLDPRHPGIPGLISWWVILLMQGRHVLTKHLMAQGGAGSVGRADGRGEVLAVGDARTQVAWRERRAGGGSGRSEGISGRYRPDLPGASHQALAMVRDCRTAPRIPTREFYLLIFWGALASPVTRFESWPLSPPSHRRRESLLLGYCAPSPLRLSSYRARPARPFPLSGFRTLHRPLRFNEKIMRAVTQGLTAILVRSACVSYSRLFPLQI